jgi:hypothetical protein
VNGFGLLESPVLDFPINPEGSSQNKDVQRDQNTDGQNEGNPSKSSAQLRSHHSNTRRR